MEFQHTDKVKDLLERVTKFMDDHGSKWFTILGILIVIICMTIYLTFKSYA